MRAKSVNRVKADNSQRAAQRLQHTAGENHDQYGQRASGHGGGKPTSKQIDLATDELAFTVKNLGMSQTP